MSGIFESIFGDEEQVTETNTEIAGHSLKRAGIFHESDRIHSENFHATDPNVTYLGRFVEGSGTVEDLLYIGSVLPGNISTEDGDINAVIDNYREDGSVVAPDTGKAQVSNFYTRNGDVQVVVNDWDDDMTFKEVAERLRDSPNFQSQNGSVEIMNGKESSAGAIPGDPSEEHAFLSMGGYVENDFFTRERLEQDWYREVSQQEGVADGRDTVHSRLAEEKEAIEQQVLEALYHNGDIKVTASELAEHEISILEDRLTIEEWREKVDDKEMLPYKVEYNQHPGSFYKRDRYKVASEFIEEAIERLDDAADTDFNDYMDAFRTEFDQVLSIDAGNVLERVMDQPETTLELDDEELQIGVTTQVELDMGILGMLPYREQLEDQGAELPDPIGGPETTESEIERYSELTDAAQDRLEKLAEHDIIGLDVDEEEDTAELLTTNHRSNEAVSATVYSTWTVNELDVAEGRGDELYSQVIESLLDAADRADFTADYSSDTVRDLVRYELYNKVEEALDLDWHEGEVDVAFDQYRDRITENRLQNTLVDRGLGGGGDMYVAVKEYVDRR